MTDEPPADWTLSFWDGPGPDDIVEYFAYVDLSGEPAGTVITWRIFQAEKEWLLLGDYGYDLGKACSWPAPPPRPGRLWPDRA
jgi:hypothetical protein